MVSHGEVIGALETIYGKLKPRSGHRDIFIVRAFVFRSVRIDKSLGQNDLQRIAINDRPCISYLDRTHIQALI